MCKLSQSITKGMMVFYTGGRLGATGITPAQKGACHACHAFDSGDVVDDGSVARASGFEGA
jgi:hypothetical protein